MINIGKTNRCHPSNEPPDNLFYDHTKSKNSTPESTMRMAENIVDFKNSQIRKYNLSSDRHGLCRWDIYYTHIEVEVIKYLLTNNIHVVIVPPNMTDDLQQMDKGVNAPLKSMIKRRFVEWRAEQSIDQLQNGVNAMDVFVDYGLTALKNIHVQWVSNAWKYVEEQGFIADSFRQVDNNLVGYTHWDDEWILNEYKNNKFMVVDPLTVNNANDDSEIDVDVDTH